MSSMGAISLTNAALAVSTAPRSLVRTSSVRTQRTTSARRCPLQSEPPRSGRLPAEPPPRQADAGDQFIRAQDHLLVAGMERPIRNPSGTGRGNKLERLTGWLRDRLALKS